jgi:hypothetical protein
MPVHIGSNIINSSSQLVADGSSSDRAARSGLDIKRLFPAKSSGYYWIQNDRMPNPLQMYVNLDSDCDGGGYDFYAITNGTSVGTTTAIHSGLVLGLDLIYPRSQGHWRAIYRFANNVLGDLAGYCQTCYAVSAAVSTVPAGAYPTAPSLNGNYTSYIMRNPKYYGTGAPDWRVADGGRWWLRDTTFGEPNGDYNPNAFLGLHAVGYSLGSDGVLSGFNDGYGSYVTGPKYLVSTNLKG